jgi:serine/threonine protein phosphatase 1
LNRGEFAHLPIPSFPSVDASDGLIPDDFTVWAFSDVHGVRSGLVAALRGAGIIDEHEAWCAPTKTALVGCGDYIDRGTDSAGVLHLLARLSVEAEAAGSRVVLLRGNHEQMLIDALDGSPAMADLWQINGGGPALVSFGLADTRGPWQTLDAVRTLSAEQSWLPPMLRATLPYARWRDVLFVHGGLPVEYDLDDLLSTVEHLWVRHAFYGDLRFVNSVRRADESGDAGTRYGKFVRAGIRRVVFGHTPQDGPRLFHENLSLDLDANACGRIDGYTAHVALAHIVAGEDLAATKFVLIPTNGSPDRWRR